MSKNRMMKKQMDYCLERAKVIRNEKLYAARKKYTKDGKVLSPEERASLLRAGKVKMRPGINKLSAWDKIYDVFDFKKHDVDGAFDQKRYRADEVKIISAYNKLADEIVLGDAETAKHLLEQFEK